MKLARGQLGEATPSVCHKRELDAEREVGERLELVVAGWYDLITLFPAVAEERRIVADQDHHGDAVTELREDLLDEPRVGLVEANIDRGKRPVARRKVPCFAELAPRIWVRPLQAVLMPHPEIHAIGHQSLGFFFGTVWNDGIDSSITTQGNLSSRKIVFCGANGAGSSSDAIVKSIVSESFASSKNR